MKLGQAVTFTQTLLRIGRSGPGGTTIKEWKARHHPPRSGIVVGVRWLSDGKRWWEDEAGYVFEPIGKPYKVALVAINIHHNPVYVPIDNVEVQS